MLVAQGQHYNVGEKPTVCPCSRCFHLSIIVLAIFLFTVVPAESSEGLDAFRFLFLYKYLEVLHRSFRGL